MSSTTTTSSSSFSPIALGHTRNSRGELGTFVNPHACSCHTCQDYTGDEAGELMPDLSFLKAIGEASIRERDQEQRPGIGGLTDGLISPSTLLGRNTTAEERASAMDMQRLRRPIQRTSSNAVFDSSSVVPLGRTATNEDTGLNLPPPPPLSRMVNRPSLSILTSLPDVDEEDTMDRLRSLRSQLQMEQDDLYKDLFTRQEIEAADERNEDLGRKIRAIENCMLEFGAIFRMR